MRTSTHQIAVFEEGFMLVGVDFADVKDKGADKVWQVIQQHPRIQARDMPVVIVYRGADGKMRAYGERKLVKSVTSMRFRDINFGHEVTLEWADTLKPTSDHEQDNSNETSE